MEIIALQTMVGIAVEMLPLPGAIGVTEGCFIFIFADIFGKQLVNPAMLLSRGLSFYVLLMMSAAVTLVAHIILLVRNKRNPQIEEIDENEVKGNSVGVADKNGEIK